MNSDPLQDEEDAFLQSTVDPLAREIISVADPWAAYEVAQFIPARVIERPDLPHTGRLYRAWSELTDLYETGKTPEADAYAVLLQAASDWLGRPGDVTEATTASWMERTEGASQRLFERDGTFWTDGKDDSPQ